jgi:hypothetical protein
VVRFVDVCSVLLVGTVVGGTLCGQNLGVSLKNRGAKSPPLVLDFLGRIDFFV